MKQAIRALALAGLVLGLSGCASSIASFSHDVTLPYQVVDPTNLGAKRGTATSTSIGTNLIVTGDASIDAAARAGGITRISHIDERRTSFLGLFSTYTIIVYGD